MKKQNQRIINFIILISYNSGGILRKNILSSWTISERFNVKSRNLMFEKSWRRKSTLNIWNKKMRKDINLRKKYKWTSLQRRTWSFCLKASYEEDIVKVTTLYYEQLFRMITTTQSDKKYKLRECNLGIKVSLIYLEEINKSLET